jgi:hypothetical protein
MVLSAVGINPLLNRQDKTSFWFPEHVDLFQLKEMCNLRGFKIKLMLASSQACSVRKVEQVSKL